MDPTTPSPRSGRIALLLGFALSVLGISLYVIQLQVERLSTPWYMPILSTVGAGLAVISLLRRRNIGRIAAAVFLVLVTAFQWSFLVVLTKLPAYSGPLAVAQPFPAFTTAWADGTPFDQTDLAGPQATAMVFFRGRW